MGRDVEGFPLSDAAGKVAMAKRFTYLFGLHVSGRRGGISSGPGMIAHVASRRSCQADPQLNCEKEKSFSEELSLRNLTNRALRAQVVDANRQEETDQETDTKPTRNGCETTIVESHGLEFLHEKSSHAHHHHRRSELIRL
jgi:hypothetical protein